ncbi:MAG TPA: cytochrome c-type biogenesis protein CcmH [Acidimicrobiales bacterium]|nr:cytochrome c-type biogenesis protein CcmH [Acidimicrobiales bacterium]
MRRPWLPVAGAIALVVAVGLGLWAGRAPSARPTVAQQVHDIASEVRCPSCSDLTAADSDAVTAVAVRDAIRARLRQGETKAEIEHYLADRYGPDILLRPPAAGFGGLVWWIPVGAVAAGALGLLLAVRRWTPARRRPSEEERAAVERLLAEGPR